MGIVTVNSVTMPISFAINRTLCCERLQITSINNNLKTNDYEIRRRNRWQKFRTGVRWT